MDDLREKHKKLLEIRKNARKDEGAIVGKCMTFCPELEGLERILRGDVSPYETDVMVKKCCEPSKEGIGEHPEDVRPINILWNVTNYLLGIYLNDQSVEAYRFVENRIRAVEMDIYAQQVTGGFLVEILERISRFYILSGYFLSGNPKFESRLNFDQLKKTISALVGLYEISTSNCKNREEFYCYHLLINMDNRYISRIPEHLNGLKARLSMEMVGKYQQNNFVGFFTFLRKLDFLSFCIAHEFVVTARLESMSIFKRALVEKIDINFFKNVLWADNEEIKSLLRRKGIEVESGKANFKDKKGVEDEEVPLMDRKIPVNIERPMRFIWYGCVDYKIFVVALSELIYGKLRELGIHSNKRCIKVDTEDFCQDFESKQDILAPRNKAAVMKICTLLLEELVKRAVVKKVSGVIFMHKVKDYLSKWRDKASTERKKRISLDTERSHLLLVMLDRKIFSALLKSRINASILNTLTPTFAYIGDVDVEGILSYNLCIFSVPKKMHEGLHKQYYMTNHIIDTPQNLSERIDEIYEKTMRATKIKRAKLLSLIRDMSKSQATAIITKLIENGRNSGFLENNLILLYKSKPLIECDVYYEEGSIEGLSLWATP